MWTIFYLFFKIYMFLYLVALLTPRTSKQRLVYQQWCAYHSLRTLPEA
jgi:hypothetical protein